MEQLNEIMQQLKSLQTSFKVSQALGEQQLQPNAKRKRGRPHGSFKYKSLDIFSFKRLSSKIKALEKLRYELISELNDDILNVLSVDLSLDLIKSKLKQVKAERFKK